MKDVALSDTKNQTEKNQTTMILKTIFAFCSLAFLFFGITGKSHNVANLYRGIFFLSFPLAIDLFELWQATENCSMLHAVWHLSALALSTISGLVALVVPFAAITTDNQFCIDHINRNEKWGLSLLFLFFLAVAYISKIIVRDFSGVFKLKEKLRKEVRPSMGVCPPTG